VQGGSEVEAKVDSLYPAAACFGKSAAREISSAITLPSGLGIVPPCLCMPCFLCHNSQSSRDHGQNPRVLRLSSGGSIVL
jgi:hypothetical protein